MSEQQRVMKKCPHCGYEYAAKPNSKRCPKCRRYLSVRKQAEMAAGKKEATQPATIEVKTVKVEAKEEKKGLLDGLFKDKEKEGAPREPQTVSEAGAETVIRAMIFLRNVPLGTAKEMWGVPFQVLQPTDQTYKDYVTFGVPVAIKYGWDKAFPIELGLIAVTMMDVLVQAKIYMDFKKEKKKEVEKDGSEDGAGAAGQPAEAGPEYARSRLSTDGAAIVGKKP